MLVLQCRGELDFSCVISDGCAGFGSPSVPLAWRACCLEYVPEAAWHALCCRSEQGVVCIEAAASIAQVCSPLIARAYRGFHQRLV
jgi:hypothetical protein